MSAVPRVSACAGPVRVHRSRAPSARAATPVPARAQDSAAGPLIALSSAVQALALTPAAHAATAVSEVADLPDGSGRIIASLSPIVLYAVWNTFLRGNTQASASHILVKDEALALELKEELAGGADFAALAAKHSTCPSSARGGDLGKFRPGQMVKEFNDVVFNDEVGVVHGPIQTDFGYHLILINERTE
mmetsp:Transcript_20031/g.65280  ORF Transcript_20031/g.65280 Transcript_20031/m.65280 type:complete len:190 (-) Transcript_20031:1128-1697(-)